MDLFIIRDGQQAGPFSESLVQTMLKDGSLHLEDMAWHKGLPAWIPLEEVLRTVRTHAEPPPVASAIRERPASARQKALLQFIGATVPDSVTREDAALAISDALENPKLTTRLTKWGEEKLRLHPDLYQEEVDFRRSNRATRFLELCQTEGAEAVKDVTKAHVQVLIESLDKRHAGWDQDSQTALWNYFLPMVAEHFPQLIQDEWKGKLKFGGKSKVAAAYSTGLLEETPSGGTVQAVMRGLIFGVIALGLVFGAIYLNRNKEEEKETKAPEKAQTKPQPAPPTTAANPSTPPTDFTLPVVTATPPEPPKPESPTAPEPAAPSPAPADLLADNSPKPAPPAEPTPVEQPAPNPPVPSQPTEPSAPSEPVVRNSAAITHPVAVQLQFGKVTLNPGTHVRLIGIEGKNIRANFQNNIVLIPAASTDVDPANTVVGNPPTPAAPITQTAPTVPAAPQPKAPTSDF